jgi:hypothetical protein
LAVSLGERPPLKRMGEWDMNRILPLAIAVVMIVAGCSRQDWATISSPLQRKPIPMPDSVGVPVVKNAAASEELFQRAKKNCWDGYQNRYLHPQYPSDDDYMGNYLKCMRQRGNYVYFPNESPDFAVREGNRIWAMNLAYINARAEEARVQQAQADQAARIQGQLENIVKQDAAGWIYNKYDAGSIHNVQVTESSGRIITLRGDYTFNGGKPGWVQADLRNRSNPCLTYWDTPQACRPLSVTRTELLAKAIEAANRASANGDRQSGGSSNASCLSSCAWKAQSCENSNSAAMAPFAFSGGSATGFALGMGSQKNCSSERSSCEAYCR